MSAAEGSREPLALDFDPVDALGVYVHVPFCRRRCPYCDFSIAVRPEIPHEAYRDAVLEELAGRADAYAGRRLETIYFGGGTPSLWSPACLGAVIEAIAARWGEATEVSVEVNPGGMRREQLAALRSAGVNRLSVGAQSFDDALLARLGRDHTGAAVEALLDDAAAVGIERVSLDLIFGVAGQRPEDFAADLARAAAAGVEQVSTYTLTIEPRTPFARRVARGAQLTAPEAAVVEMFALADARLGDAGMARYEPSNIARPGAWSRHNLIYWLGGVYLGLGMGAHSLWRGADGGATRRAATPDLKRYLAGPLSAPRVDEDLSPALHLAERLFLGLRTRFALDLDALAGVYGEAAVGQYAPALEALTARGLIARRGARVWTRADGLLFHDTIAARVMDEAP